MLEALCERQVPERRLGVEVVDALSVDRAVPRVVEATSPGVKRFDSSAAAVVTTLKVEPGAIEPLGRTVDQRRGRPAVGRDAVDLPEVLLDEVRVVRRGGGHHEELPAARVERDDGAARRPERVERDALCVEIEGRDDRVADDRLPGELVELLVDEVGERAVGTR